MKITLNLFLCLSFLSSISALSQEGIRKLAERALQNGWTDGGGNWQQDPPQTQQPFTLVDDLAGQIDGSIMAYRINPNDPRVGKDTISIVYQIPTLAWAAIGFSPNGGNMVGSEAVIAIPETGEILKYQLGGKSLQGVQPMPANQQTLVEKGMIQEQGTTTFAFTKIMVEPNEVPIVTDNLNIFLGAWGSGNALGIHAVRQPFSIDLNNGDVELVVPPIAQAPPPAADDEEDDVGAGAPVAAGEAIALGGQLDGSEVAITVNLADPNAGNQDTITVEYTIPALAWAGIAFNDNGGNMIGSQAVIGVPSTGEVLKYELNGKSAAAVVPFGDAQQTLIDASVTQDEAAGTTTLVFTKIMAEAGEIEIFNDANTFLGAWGFNNDLGIHAVRDAFALDLANLDGGVGDVENARKISFWRAHGLIAGIAWGVLSPLAIGASVVRQLFKGPLWFKIHRGVNMLVVLSTVVAFILAVVAINLETPEGFKPEHFPKNPPHRMVGLVIFIIALLQALLGIFRPHATEPGETKTTIRFAWEIAHKFLGYACLGMAIYQVQSGIKIYSNIFQEGDIALVIFWTVIAVIIGSILCGLVAINFFGYGAKDDDVKASTKSAGSDKESTDHNDAKEQPTV